MNPVELQKYAEAQAIKHEKEMQIACENRLKEIIDKQEEEITRLNNIIDELEKYIKEQMEYYKSNVDYYSEYELTLQRLQELKEGK